MGAGSIGGYLGGRLMAAGSDVVLVGRPSLGGEIAAHGLTITDYLGYARTLAAGAVPYATQADALARCDFVLVTVKGPATEEAARELAPHLAQTAVVVSLQNGVRNADVLRRALPGRRVLAGMVPFNVVRRDHGGFHRGTSGELVVEATPDGVERPLVGALVAAGVPALAATNLSGIQWGKLLLNLNNALNALAGVPLLEQIRDSGYRRVLAAAVAEALLLLRAAGIRPEVSLPLPLWALAPLLRMPSFVFTRVARRLMAIDPRARSSMWEDLERRRPTEIAQLNGEIVALARELRMRAPVNERIVALVGGAERRAEGSPRMSAAALVAATLGG